MCLTTTLKKPLKAEEDIVCYKVYNKIGNNGKYECFFRSSHRCHLYPGKFIRPNRLLSGFEKSRNSRFNKLYDIKGGAIHSYKYKPGNYKSINKNATIFKCIIPKGTRYYVSYDSKEYASRKIRIIGEVK